MTDIPGFEGLYRITKNGEVFSYARMRANNRWHQGQRLAQKKDKDGYIVLILTDLRGNQYNIKVHQIVMELFGPPRPSNLHHPNHKDLDKSNNDIYNLEWLTNKENTQHALENGKHFTPFKDLKGEGHYKAIVTEEIVLEIRKRYKRYHKTDGLTPMSKEFGIAITTIKSIVDRASWKHI